LERFLGKKTMEVEILKDAIEIAREKKLISRVPFFRKDDTP
jgi:transposase